jgi:hypothetical protein
MRLIIIINFFVFLNVGIYAQLAAKLTQIEYDIYNNKIAIDRNNLILQKIKLLCNSDLLIPSLMQELERVDVNLIADSIQRNYFLWNAALISHLHGSAISAASYIEQFDELQVNKTISSSFLQYLIYTELDTAKASHTLQQLVIYDTVFSHLKYLHCEYSYIKKHHHLFILYSAILPGLGTALNGDLLGGITSTAIFATSIYGVVQLLKLYMYINAIAWAAGNGLRFYFGNLKLTDKAFLQSQNKHKSTIVKNNELWLEKILNKYPINPM